MRKRNCLLSIAVLAIGGVLCAGMAQATWDYYRRDNTDDTSHYVAGCREMAMTVEDNADGLFSDMFDQTPHVGYFRNVHGSSQSPKDWDIMCIRWYHSPGGPYGGEWVGGSVERLESMRIETVDGAEFRRYWPQSIDIVLYDPNPGIPGDETVGGMVYAYVEEYYNDIDYSPVFHLHTTHIKYVSLPLPLMGSPTPEYVIPPMEWQRGQKAFPAPEGSGGAHCVRLGFHENGEPAVAFTSNGFHIPATLPEAWWHPQIGFRSRYNGAWQGSGWDDVEDYLTWPVVDGPLDHVHFAGLSMAMEPVGGVPEPRIAYTVHASPNGHGVNYVETIGRGIDAFGYLVGWPGPGQTAVTGADYDEDAGKSVRVSLALDVDHPTDPYKPCIAYEGGNVYYTERNADGLTWITPQLVESCDHAVDYRFVRLGSLCIDPRLNGGGGTRWVSVNTLDDHATNVSGAYRYDSATQSWDMDIPSIVSICSGQWQPAMDLLRTGTPVAAAVSVLPAVNGQVLKKPSIVVRVSDSKEETPIEGATVSWVGASKPSFDKDLNDDDWIPSGTYLFLERTPATHNLQVTHPDYDPVTVTGVQVTRGLCTSIAVEMEPADGCGAAAARRQHPAFPIALLPLAPAALALALWAVHRRRRATLTQ